MSLSWCMRREQWILFVSTSKGFDTNFSDIFIGKMKKYRLEKEMVSGLKTAWTAGWHQNSVISSSQTSFLLSQGLASRLPGASVNNKVIQKNGRNKGILTRRKQDPPFFPMKCTPSAAQYSSSLKSHDPDFYLICLYHNDRMINTYTGLHFWK